MMSGSVAIPRLTQLSHRVEGVVSLPLALGRVVCVRGSHKLHSIRRYIVSHCNLCLL